MDLSVNKIISNQPNFKGVKGEFNRKNVPVFKFNPPPYDKEKEFVTLEFLFLDFDEDKNEIVRPLKKNVVGKDFEDDKPLRIAQDAFKAGDFNSKAFAYRYKISQKNNPQKCRYFTDSFEKVKTIDTDEEFSVVRLSDTYKIDSKKGAMRHSFLDSDAILDLTGKLNTKDKHIARNHFNKLGGSTKGLIELLKSGELDPYRYIISTPDIGNDPTSSHKYWPNNLYQCQNMQDFKDLNYELFTRGKGYVADGAFTDQSLQSPIFQHVLKWGKKSPFYNMFKLDGSNKVVLGILPNDIKEDEDSAYNHIGIRIVNNPYDDSYDKNKPILFQLYDNRLSSYEQRNDSTKLIDAYDRQPEDIFEITHNDDSVYPFYFEADSISLPDVKEKIALFKNKNSMSLNEMNKKMGISKFLDFGSFVIAPDRHHASNATFWDGNRDIVKLNLSNPKDFTDGEISDDNKIGMENARKYLYGVARFHTEGIQNDLILRSAKLKREEREKIAQANNIDNFREIILGNNIKSPILEKNNKIDEYIIEFPLQSLETSPELSAIFSQPQFNKEFLLYDDNFNTLSEYVDSIIESAISNVPKQDKEDYKKYVVKTCSNEILREILAASLSPKAVDYKGDVNLDTLKEVTLKSLAGNAQNPQEERSMVIKAISEELQEVDLIPIKNKLTKELRNISLSDFKEAETLVIQSNAGLNWRFDAAKDIGDLDSVRAGRKNFKDIWDGIDGVTEFWHDFIKTVKEYNPSSYIVAELTDLWSFYSGDNKEIQLAFDKNGVDPSKKENNFLIEIGATTNSNYSQYFNKLSCFLGVNPEKAYDWFNKPIERAGNLEQLRGTVKDFISSSQPSTALLTHEFFDNHDKPRLLHCLPLNMQLFLCDTDDRSKSLQDYIKKLPDNEQNSFKNKVKEVTGRDDYSKINPMALAVGFVMFDEINKSEYSEVDKNKLKFALKELVNGQKNQNSPYNFKRAKSFGTKPYEITIRELFKRAGLEDNIDEKVKDFHSSMLKPSMEYLERLWQVMNAIVGTPTLFNGTEFAQTGYETFNKNVYVDNRNQILHNLKNDKRYKDMYDRIYASGNLYNQPQMSAIRDGFPVLCKINTPKIDLEGVDKAALDKFISKITYRGGIKAVDALFENGKMPDGETLKKKFELSDDKNTLTKFVMYYKTGILEDYYNGVSFFPIFKYDDKGSKVLSIITNNGIAHGQYAYQAIDSGLKDVEVDSIDLIDDSKNCPMSEGTRLKKKVYNNGKYENEKDNLGNDVIYIIENMKLKRLDGQKIKFEDTVVNFFVDRTPAITRGPKNAVIQ